MDRASCEPQRLAQSLPRQVLPAGKDIRADCRCLRMAHRSQDVLILSCASAMTRAERHASPHESGLPGGLALTGAGGPPPTKTDRPARHLLPPIYSPAEGLSGRRLGQPTGSRNRRRRRRERGRLFLFPAGASSLSALKAETDGVASSATGADGRLKESAARRLRGLGLQGRRGQVQLPRRSLCLRSGACLSSLLRGRPRVPARSHGERFVRGRPCTAGAGLTHAGTETATSGRRSGSPLEGGAGGKDLEGGRSLRPPSGRPAAVRNGLRGASRPDNPVRRTASPRPSEPTPCRRSCLSAPSVFSLFLPGHGPQDCRRRARRQDRHADVLKQARQQGAGTAGAKAAGHAFWA